MVVAALLMAVGSVVRLVPSLAFGDRTSGLVNASVANGQTRAGTLGLLWTGQALIGMANPFTAAAASLLASEWYAPHLTNICIANFLTSSAPTHLNSQRQCPYAPTCDCASTHTTHIYLR
jgi:hypothetical protein